MVQYDSVDGLFPTIFPICSRDLPSSQMPLKHGALHSVSMHHPPDGKANVCSLRLRAVPHPRQAVSLAGALQHLQRLDLDLAYALAGQAHLAADVL